MEDLPMEKAGACELVDIPSAFIFTINNITNKQQVFHCEINVNKTACKLSFSVSLAHRSPASCFLRYPKRGQSLVPRCQLDL
jgi:hypothetical protein